MWTVSVPLAFCLSRFTDMSIVPLYLICNGSDIIKSIIGLCMVKRGSWIKNLTNYD
jgi:Na+-driven multidrug efflux pump